MAGAAAVAGTASALLGVVQFAVGALVAPLGGLGGDGALLPVAAVVEGSAVAALLAAALPAARRGRVAAAATAEGHPA
jgi:DHA1 family bicyclomycin/chloramphenicol resistance-like MFS transporter